MNPRRHVLTMLVLFKMKKMKRICYLLLLSSTAVLSQVGIGTITPNAVLEIKSTNETTPANTDGLLIPKIEEFPTTNPTALQDGMMVFATGAGAVTKGFYYWDNGLTAWVAAAGAKEINDLVDGKSDAIGSSVFIGVNAGANDAGTGNRNIGIGRNSLFFTISGIKNIGIGYNSLLNNNDGGQNTGIGDASLSSNTNGNYNTGFGSGSLSALSNGGLNTSLGAVSLPNLTNGSYNTNIGAYSLYNLTDGSSNVGIGQRAGNNITTGDGNVFIGYQSGAALSPVSISGSILIGYESGRSETNNNRLYIENSSSTSPLIYGEFDTNILRANGTFQIGNPTFGGYAFPTANGSVGQVLQTNGAGVTSWVDPSASVIHNINDLVDGKSDNDGTNDGSSIFFGIDAGINDDGTDNQNVGVGFQTLLANTIGFSNTASGYQALNSNSTGSANTAVGRSSQSSNTTGFGNTTIGNNSLYTNTTGYGNTVMGGVALYANTTGYYNTVIGTGALNLNTTGVFNTALGGNAGANSIGDGNIYLGYNAGFIETGSNKLYIENSNSTAPLIYGEFDNDIVGINGSLGVGTQAPEAPFHVKEEGTSGVQTIVAAIESSTSNRPVLQFSESSSIDLNAGMSLEYDGRGTGGANRMVFNGVGGNPLFEFRNGGDLTLRDGDIIVRGAATDREIKLEDDAGNPDRALMRQTGTQDIYVGDIDNNAGDLYLRAGGSDEIAIIAGTGFVGINTLTPAYTLEVNGTAAKPGGGSWTNVSDRRLKKNIQAYTAGLKTLLQIEPISYQYNDDSGFDTMENHVGVIAQELQKTAPSMVTSYQKAGTEYLAVNNSEMTYLLINAVKEQHAEIAALKEAITQLNMKIDAIK